MCEAKTINLCEHYLTEQFYVKEYQATLFESAVLAAGIAFFQ